MNKKINLYINGVYVCSSNKYKLCKDFRFDVVKNGGVSWASVPSNGSYTLKQGDKIRCSYK